MTKADAQQVARLLDAARVAHELEDAKQATVAVAPLPLLTDEQCAAVDEMAGIA